MSGLAHILEIVRRRAAERPDWERSEYAQGELKRLRDEYKGSMEHEPLPPIILYHAACKDGFAAAWAHNVAVRDRRRFVEGTEYIAVFHGTLPPLDKLRGREVILLDFCYKRAQMVQIAQAAASLLVLDHHKSAAEDMAGFSSGTIVFDMQRSGAGLAWDHFAGTRRPWVINYIEDRDLWRKALPHNEEVSAYLASLEFDFQTWDKELALDQPDAARLHAGEALMARRAQFVREVAKNAMRVTFEGHTVPIVNSPQVDISELLDVLAAGHQFAIGWWQLADGRFKYSLRTRDKSFDLTAIAKKYGGGGHQSAAGFEASGPIHLWW